MYEKLAKRSLFRNNEPQALGYYIKALTDMSRAIKASESLDKKMPVANNTATMKQS